MTLPVNSEPLYIPRYTPSYLELSLNGTQESAAPTNSRSYNAVPEFKLAITTNPFFLYSNDRVNILDYFSLLIGFSANGSEDQIISDSLYALSNGNTVSIRKTHDNIQYGLHGNLKYGLLPFMDLMLGGGVSYVQDALTLEDTLYGNPRRFISTKKNKIAWIGRDYFLETGFDLFIPDFPQFLLSVSFQQINHPKKFSYLNDIDPINFPSGIQTDMKSNPFRFYVGLTYSHRNKNPIRVRQDAFEDEIKSLGLKIQSLPEDAPLSRISKLSTEISATFDSLTKKDDLSETVTNLKYYLMKKQRIRGNKLVWEIKMAYKDKRWSDLIEGVSQDLAYLHPIEKEKFEDLLGEIYGSLFENLTPAEIQRMSIRLSWHPIGTTIKTGLYDRFQRDMKKAGTSFESRFTFIEGYKKIFWFKDEIKRFARSHTIGDLKTEVKLDVENNYRSNPPNQGWVNAINKFIQMYSDTSFEIGWYVELARLKLKTMEWKYENRQRLIPYDSLKLRSAINGHNIEELNKRRSKYQSYKVIGKIEQMEGDVAILWGQAAPEYGYSEGEYQPGLLLQEDNITVLNVNPRGIQGANYYIGSHCFIKKIPAKGKFGQGVSNYVYGTCSSEKDKLDRDIEILIEYNDSIKENIDEIGKEMNIKEYNALNKSFEEYRIKLEL